VNSGGHLQSNAKTKLSPQRQTSGSDPSIYFALAQTSTGRSIVQVAPKQKDSV